jgi:hypothetical protein
MGLDSGDVEPSLKIFLPPGLFLKLTLRLTAADRVQGIPSKSIVIVVTVVFKPKLEKERLRIP